MAISNLSKCRYAQAFAEVSCKVIGGALKGTGVCVIPVAVAHLCKAASFFMGEQPVYSHSVLGTDVTQWSEGKEPTYAWCLAAAAAGCVASTILSKAGEALIAKGNGFRPVLDKTIKQA